eukprot:144980-Chlamydomonas_euryale.AAC.1
MRRGGCAALFLRGRSVDGVRGVGRGRSKFAQFSFKGELCACVGPSKRPGRGRVCGGAGRALAGVWEADRRADF